jgi:hypothetical protein
MKNVEKAIVREADEMLERLVAEASTKPIGVKLRNLNDVCRAIVLGAKQRLSVPEVLRQYKVRFPDASQSLSEQTVRNNRANGNPYQALYRKWEDIAEHVLRISRAGPVRAAGAILAESDIRKIEDVTLRHQVFLLFAQNRSLHNQINIMKQAATDVPMQVAGSTLAIGGADLVLTDGEVDAVRDFIDPRKLRARHLAKTNDGGLSTRDGRSIADPGFVAALEKIAKSHQRP